MLLTSVELNHYDLVCNDERDDLKLLLTKVSILLTETYICNERPIDDKDSGHCELDWQLNYLIEERLLENQVLMIIFV